MCINLIEVVFDGQGGNTGGLDVEAAIDGERLRSYFKRKMKMKYNLIITAVILTSCLVNNIFVIWMVGTAGSQ